MQGYDVCSESKIKLIVRESFGTYDCLGGAQKKNVCRVPFDGRKNFQFRAYGWKFRHKPKLMAKVRVRLDNTSALC